MLNSKKQNSRFFFIPIFNARSPSNDLSYASIKHNPCVVEQVVHLLPLNLLLRLHMEVLFQSYHKVDKMKTRRPSPWSEDERAYLPIISPSDVDLSQHWQTLKKKNSRPKYLFVRCFYKTYHVKMVNIQITCDWFCNQIAR